MIHEWMEAEALWLDRKAATPAPDTGTSTILDGLFYDQNKGRRTPTGWTAVNAAERALARVLTPSQLCAQYAALLDIATRRSLPGLGGYPSKADFAAKSDDDKRSIYTSLLYALQSAFVDLRYVRRLRSDVSVTMFRFGLAVVLVAVAVPLLWLWHISSQLHGAVPSRGHPAALHLDETMFALAAVATWGALGGFFSRAMRFQADLPKLDFETVMQTYVYKMLRLRILYGMIGAVVFYLVMRGAFVGGNLFPTISAGMISDETVWQLDLAMHPAAKAGTAAAVTAAPTLTAALAPTEQFAKLLVWSFLAGFSERLVPDTLSQLERKSDEAAGKAG